MNNTNNNLEKRNADSENILSLNFLYVITSKNK